MHKANEINRAIKPLHGKPVELLAEEPQGVVLDNGIELYGIHAGEEEIIRLDIVVKAGTAYQDKRLVASGAGKLLKEGTKNLRSGVIAGIFDSRGAHLEVTVTKDSAVVSFYSLNKHLNELLPVIGEMLTASIFPPDEFSTHIERQRAEFLTNSEKVKYKAMIEFNAMVFGDNSAYGQSLQVEDFDKISRQDVVDFYHQRYIPQNIYMIVSGKLDDSIILMMNKYLGNSWASKSYPPKEPVFVEPVIPIERIIKKEGALQSAIRVGRPIISKTHPDYNAFILLNTVFGGFFGSRLMSNLREDKGFTYGVHSFVANYIQAGYFSIATEVNVKHTRAALDEIFTELKRLREHKVDEVELHLVKNYIYGTFLRNFDGPFALAERYRAVKDFGLSFDFYKQSLKEILAVDADNLIETARKYFDPHDMIRLVIGQMD